MRETPLVGDDSQLFLGDLSETEFSGDGSKTITLHVTAQPGAGALDTKMCVITAKAAAGSIFPAGLKPGELFPALGTEVPVSGDKFRFLNLGYVADAAGWSIGITQQEIEVTKLGDRYKKYRLGKKDASGTLSSIFTTGESDKTGGIINRNMKLFRRDAAGTVTVSDEANRSLYMLGYVNRAALPGEVDDFVFCQIFMFNVTLGGQSGSAQSYDSSIRLTGLDPVFYSLEPQTAQI
jgi:hypothetical protein